MDHKGYAILGDVHGCFDTMIALIDKIPKDRKIIFCGDLIDRGPKSREVIKFVKENSYDCVMGNHELMGIESTRSIGAGQMFMSNGGKFTLDNYGYYDIDKNDGKWDSDAWKEDVAWLKSLPVCLMYNEGPDLFNRKLLVSHTTIASFWDEIKDGTATDPDKYVWERRHFPKSIPLYYNVYGHTPVEKPVIKDHFANIDTGCVYNGYGNYGRLTALLFPELTIIDQECIDDVKFSVHG